MFSKIVLIALFVANLSHVSYQDPMFPGNQKCDRGCFGWPYGCQAQNTSNCEILLLTKPQDDGHVEFKLYWQYKKSRADWVAVALSKDNEPGNDSMSLFYQETDWFLRIFDLEGIDWVHNDTYGFTEEKVSGINMHEPYILSSSEFLYQNWTRAPQTQVAGIDFNLLTTQYYIFLTRGKMDYSRKYSTIICLKKE